VESIDVSALANGIAGIASLIIATLLYPTVRSLRTLIERHDERLDDHGERLAKVETVVTAKRVRRRSRR